MTESPKQTEDKIMYILYYLHLYYLQCTVYIDVFILGNLHWQWQVHVVPGSLVWEVAKGRVTEKMENEIRKKAWLSG